MASDVVVERAAIQSGIGCCKVSIHELEAASSGLKKSYERAGSSGFRDQKYAALGGIVEECCSALTKPVGELQECISRLEDLLAAVEDYESTSL